VRNFSQNNKDFKTLLPGFIKSLIFRKGIKKNHHPNADLYRLVKFKLFLQVYLTNNQTINIFLIDLPLHPFQKGMIGIYRLIVSIFLWSTDF